VSWCGIETCKTKLYSQPIIHTKGLGLLRRIKSEYLAHCPVGKVAYWKDLRYIIDEIERLRQENFFVRAVLWLVQKWDVTPKRQRNSNELVVGTQWLLEPPKVERAMEDEQWNVVKSDKVNKGPKTLASAVFKMNRSGDGDPLQTTIDDLEKIFAGRNQQDGSAIYATVSSRNPEGSTRFKLDDIKAIVREQVETLKTQYASCNNCIEAICTFESQLAALEAFVGSWGVDEFSKSSETLSNELRDKFAILKRTCSILWSVHQLQLDERKA
jgi:hypothetical protein